MSVRRMRLPRHSKPSTAGKFNFIGLDISLTDTGIVILDHEAELIHHSSIKTTPKRTDMERKNYILDTLRDTIVDNTQMCDLAIVCIEDYAYGRSTGKVFTRAELSGTVKRWLYEVDMPVFVISPTSVKAWVAGGRSKKEEIMMAVHGIWGFQTNNDNIADAFVVAKMLEAFVMRREPLALVNAHGGAMVWSAKG